MKFFLGIVFVLLTFSPIGFAQDYCTYTKELPKYGPHRSYTQEQYDRFRKTSINSLQSMLKITQWREEGLTQDQFTTKVRKLYLLTNVNSRFKQTIFQYNFHLHEMIRLSNYFEEHKNIDWLPHLKEVSNFMEASEEKIANGTSPNWAYREYGITVSNISRMLIDVINYSFKYDRGHVEDQKMNRKYYILPELQKIPSPSLLNGTNGQAATKRYIKHIRELLAQKRIEFTVKMENTKPEDIVLTPREKKSIDNKAIQDAKIHWHDLKERRARNFWKEAPYMIENHLHKGTLEVLLDDQRAWLAQHLCSNEYLNRLEKEVQKTKTSAKDIKTKRMNQLYKKDYHIKFKDSGFLAKMGVDQLYSKWIPDENVVHFYAYDVALHPIQGIHEFSHQMVQGDEYLTEYAKNLYKQIIPKNIYTQLKYDHPSILLDDYEYFAKAGELDARRLCFIYEMEIDEWFDPRHIFTEENIKKLQSLIKNGDTALSNNSAQFLLLFEPKLIVKILNELA